MMILVTNWGNASLMALVSICLVFVMLVLLICVLKLFGVIFAEKKVAVTTSTAVSSDEINEEEVAAIAMAVNLFFNRHDEESDVLTFRQNHDVSAWQVRNINKQLK
ncbi:MAG: OadG family protein [Alistipes sp.]|nr:OadG family protein [Alistipes sp.]